jgi:hypothetical protein
VKGCPNPLDVLHMSCSHEEERAKRFYTDVPRGPRSARLLLFLAI